MRAKPLVCVAGATGTGKSAVALHLAQLFQGEIINADSRQVYTAFPLVAAIPPEQERALLPHHLYAFVAPEQSISAGLWAAKAKALIDDCHTRGKLPILVGGTGMYLRALFDPIAVIPAIPEAVKSRINQEYAAAGLESLYRCLCERDPAYAARIHSHDKQRIFRALEVSLHTGKAFSEWHAQSAAPLVAAGLCLGMDMDLAALTPRLTERVHTMLHLGAEDEVRRAFTEIAEQDKPLACLEALTVFARHERPGPLPEPTSGSHRVLGPGWSSIGCRELLAYICGTVSRELAVQRWGANTRAYAKRQITWFRSDQRLEWFAPDDMVAITQRVACWLRH